MIDLKMDAYPSVGSSSRSAVAFDPFVFCVEEVIHSAENLDIMEQFIGRSSIQQRESRECDPGSGPGGEILVLPFSGMDEGEADMPLF